MSKKGAPESPGRLRKQVEAARQLVEEAEEHYTSGQAFGSAAQSLPDSFPGYEITREIHRGGQGIVYQAIQESTHRKVALKVLREGSFATPADTARFQREVRILGQLNHANIVTIHDSGEAKGHFYFVMDYIPGQPLDKYMAKHKQSIEDTLKLFTKICEAVNAAHLHGINHRDLKPSNIRIDDEGEPHVLDFGLAKASKDENDENARTQALTITGQFLGSLPWASPEQAAGTPHDIDVRTDVYSLGVILYQMLTGSFPYEVVGNMRDVLDNIVKNEPTKPSTVRRQINDEVETIVLKCLSKDRQRRYQTAGEVARDTCNYLSGKPIEAKRDSGWYVFKKTIKRHKGRASVAAVLLVLVFVSIAVIATMRERQMQAHDRALAAEESASIRQYQLTISKVAVEKRDRVQAYLDQLRAPIDERKRGYLVENLDVLSDICTRIRLGEASELDMRTLGFALVKTKVKARSLLDEIDARDLKLDLEYKFESRIPLPADFGALITDQLFIDKTPVGVPKEILMALPKGWVGTHQYPFGASFTLGHHRLHGSLRLQIVEMGVIPEYPRTDQYFEIEDIPKPKLEHIKSRFPGAVIDLPIEEFNFTVVPEYPKHHPHKITSQLMAEEFDKGFVLKRISFVVTDYTTLFIQMSFKAPLVPVAFDGVLFTADHGWNQPFRFLANSNGGFLFSFEEDVSNGHCYDGIGSFHMRARSDEEGRRMAEDGCDTSLRLMGNRMKAVIPLGTCIHLRMTASQDVARSHPDVSEYLDMQIERSIELTSMTPSEFEIETQSTPSGLWILESLPGLLAESG